MKNDMVKQDRYSFDHTYQERISFLMGRDREMICALYIDVTNDSLLNVLIKDQNDVEHRFEPDNVKDKDIRSWLSKNIYSYMVFQWEKDEFRALFNRETLLRKYDEGDTYFRFSHCYNSQNMKNMKNMMYDVEVSVFCNPYSGNIESFVIWKDDTRNYIDTEIRKILYQKDYRDFSLIDVRCRNIYFRTHNFTKIDVETETTLAYDDVVNQTLSQRIAPKSKREYAKCTKLDYIVDRLELADQYSFRVYNVMHDIERYSYYWFDRERQIILCTVDDMTVEMENDSVTGALSRDGFVHRAGDILKRNPDRDFAVLYFNMQRFKTVNELFGYEVGDNVLRSAADVLQNSFLKPLALGRLEADRFAALVDVNDLDFERLPELLHGYHSQGNINMDIYGRCGVYYVDKSSRLKVSDMCDRANLAKSYISNQYVKPYAVFNEQMSEDYDQTSQVLIKLDEAISNGDILVYYQPIYEAQTRSIIGGEALARWNWEQSGIMLPGKFIPALEENGYITKLDTFIYNSICEFLNKRSAVGLPLPKVTVNLSRMDLMDKNIMNAILDGARNSKMLKEYICCEITESAYAAISSIGNKFLAGLREEGVILLLDDFGSGISSFSTIRDYDFNVVKLDMGFTKKLRDSNKNRNIVIAVIEMVHRLGMRVLAEGVETAEQADFLEAHGCDLFQGYYFSKPVSEDEFVKLFDSK